MKPEEIEALKSHLRTCAGGPHSFDQVRDCAGLAVSDEELARLIQEQPRTFRAATVSRSDAIHDRVKPGRPGIALIRP